MLEIVRDYLKTATGFLRESSKAFNAVKKKDVREAFRYLLVLGFIVAILQIIVQLLIGFATTDMEQAFASYYANPAYSIAYTFIVIYLSSVVSSTIVALWLHLWAFIFGARKGLGETIKTVFYGQSPLYLMGWIPLLNFVAMIWSFILMGTGLTRLQSMDAGKAAAAMLLAVIIPLIIVGILAFTLYNIFGPSIFQTMGI